MVMLRVLGLVLALGLSPEPAEAEDAARLADAMAAVGRGDWSSAAAEAARSGPLAVDIVAWHWLRAGEGRAQDYAAFLARRADWPGLPLLQRRGEAAVAAGAGPAEVVAYFANRAPQTAEGSLAYHAALLATGDRAGAGREAVRAWRALPMSAAEQAGYLDRAGAVLAEHHGGRMVTLLAEGWLDNAERLLPLTTSGTRAVAEARIALQDDRPGVDALIAAVPDHMAGSAGLAHDRFRWRIRRDRYDDAADLLLERSGSADSLGVPEDWARWRAILARREMREGDAGRAYRIAANHHLTEGGNFADLEFLAGYIALRKLNDPARAQGHFRTLRISVGSPISLSRAAYWEGRALEQMGRADEARTSYAFAAEFQTAFYGLLAAERAGLPFDARLAGGESFPDWRQSPAAASSVFAAAVLLREAGETALAERFLLHLSESLDGREIGALAGLALDWGEPHMALMLAKAAVGKGVIWPTAYFPVTDLAKMDLPVRPELALAIARRESEFDPRVVSPAGARGLMQVMPGTAKLMAGELGIGYDHGKLTGDWAYNARLGAGYLARLIEEFGDVPVLVAAGYNAGPGRPRRWVEDLGDPRAGDDATLVDWIEHIPFTETRNYVMRVGESLPVYRARLGRPDAVPRLAAEMAGR